MSTITERVPNFNATIEHTAITSNDTRQTVNEVIGYHLLIIDNIVTIIDNRENANPVDVLNYIKDIIIKQYDKYYIKRAIEHTPKR